MARTLEAPQAQLEDFLQKAGRELGHRANIRNVASTRITFLESSGVKKALRTQHRTGPRDVNKFSYWMSNQLDPYRMKPITVGVNTDHPLKIMGENNDKLVLNISEDEQLLAERDRTETLLEAEFGELPKLKIFDPHVTIGFIGNQILSRLEIRRPESMLPGVGIPESIALNGLMVYVDGVGLKH